MDNIKHTNIQKHIFTLEITLEAESRLDAQKQLAYKLKLHGLHDFRIMKDNGDKPPMDKPTDPKQKNVQITELLQTWMKVGTLVRLSVLKGKGVKLSVPCRILHFDEDKGNISVYHVDDKVVHLISLNEIDDYSV